jgi:hypothetical protein
MNLTSFIPQEKLMNTIKPCKQLNKLMTHLAPLYHLLKTHPIYNIFHTIKDLHIFMEAHVFAVWDFMSLLKVLQNKLTCTQIPWIPNQYQRSARFINEIVLGEESDRYSNAFLSHFEIYLQAMRECGASISAIETLLNLLRKNVPWNKALSLCNAPKSAQNFVEKTFSIVHGDQLHGIAAAFTFGREDVIPEMFREFIHKQNDCLKQKLKTLHWYFERHINIDADEHGPMALEMMKEICGSDLTKWKEAEDSAETAIRARINLWDNIVDSIKCVQISEVNNEIILYPSAITI